MSMTRVIEIDGKQVPFKASAAIPRIYRVKYGRDIFKDLMKLEKALNDNSAEDSNLDLFSLETFENIAYLMAKHADPFISLLDIKIAHIFKALNGIGDARGSQVGLAQVDPLDTKFGFGIQQGTEGGGKSRDPSCGLGAHDPLGGNVHETDADHGFRAGIRQ